MNKPHPAATRFTLLAALAMPVLLACSSKISTSDTTPVKQGTGSASTDGGSDISAPTISVAMEVVTPLNVTPMQLQVTFSEEVPTPKVDDFVVTGGTATDITGTGTTYIVAIEPTGDGTITVTLASNAVASIITGIKSASQTLTAVFDSTPPNAPTVTGTSPSATSTPTWTWIAAVTNGGNGIFRCKLDNDTFSDADLEQTDKAFTAPTALANGVHTLYVQERDAVGNWSPSASFAITVAASTDALPPTPGNTGNITATAVGTTSLTLNWTAATDNASAPANLQYLAYYSTSNNIATVVAAETNGTVVGAYTAAIASKPVTGLSAATTYYFTIIVKDQGGNKAVYNTIAQATAGGDSVAPTATSYTIVASNLASASLTLTWTKATDNASAQTSLQYEVRRSASNNLGSVENIESNGTTVCNYSTDTDSCNVSGLAASTTYYFNVIVRDANTNKRAYTTVSASTTATVSAGIANVSNKTALGNGSQRKSFYDAINSKHWAFYFNGTAIEYAYSSNATTWTVAGTTPYATADFSVSYRAIGGTAYVFLAVQANTYDIVLRRGALGASSITFAAEQTALDGASATDLYVKPAVTLDGNDKVWVAAVHRNSTSNSHAYLAKVRRSTNAGNGDLSAWDAASSLGTRSAAISDLALLPRTSNQVYLLVNGPLLYGFAFDGTSWSASNASGVSGWLTFPGGFEGNITAALVAGTTVYIGGTFSNIGGVPGTSNIAKWDGTSWTALGRGVDNSVSALAMIGTDLYAGGSFVKASSVTVNKIAKWNGSTWSALGTGVDDVVSALAVSGTDLFVGGAFTSAGGAGANRVAKWNGAAWSALGVGVDQPVLSLAVDGSNLYVGGEFANAGGAAANYIAKWNGSAWSVLGVGVDGAVYSLLVDGSDLYAAGNFSNAGGSAAPHIAKWNGSAWSSLGTGIDQLVMAITKIGSNLFATGSFLNADGSPATALAKWDGTAWSAMGAGLDGAGYVATASGTTLYIAGEFKTIGGVAANGIASWDGTTWTSFSPMGIQGDVEAAAMIGSDLYVGGTFTRIDGVTRAHVAKWDGTTWSSLGSGVDDAVHALAVIGSDLYVGGAFANAGGAAAGFIAKWDGSSWSTLGDGVFAEIYALTPINTDLYATGAFTFAGVVNADHIAKWDGTAWSALGAGLDGHGRALAVIGTDLYVGGDFTHAGGGNANYIAKWNGTTWSTLGSGMDSYIYALVASGTDIYAGGNFADAGGVAASYIAKWNGTVWSALGSGTGGTVRALAKVGSNIFVGGDFSAAGGVTTHGIAKWNGSAWLTASETLSDKPGLSVANGSTSVRTFAVTANDLYAGGAFSAADSFGSINLARLRTSSPDAIGEGGPFGMSAVSDTTTGHIFVARTHNQGPSFNSFNGTAWSAATSFSATDASLNALSYDPVTGNYWLFWRDIDRIKLNKFTFGSGWSGIQNFTTNSIEPVGIAVDFDMAAGVVKVLIQDAKATPNSIVVKTAN